jgi:hypothetical protein
MGLCVGIGHCVGHDSSAGEVIVPATGRPLERHPDWRIHGGVEPSDLGWLDDGATIQFFFNDPHQTVTNLMHKGFSGVEGIITAEYANPGGNRDWLLPFAKFVNTRNLIGARLNNNHWEIVQRSGGTWTTLASGGTVFDGDIEVIITADHISVSVNGSLQLEKDHSIADAGGFGISAHQWGSVDNTSLRNYAVAPIVKDFVEHNGVAVTHDGDPVYVI